MWCVSGIIQLGATKHNGCSFGCCHVGDLTVSCTADKYKAQTDNKYLLPHRTIIDAKNNRIMSAIMNAQMAWSYRLLADRREHRHSGFSFPIPTTPTVIICLLVGGRCWEYGAALFCCNENIYRNNAEKQNAHWDKIFQHLQINSADVHTFEMISSFIRYILLILYGVTGKTESTEDDLMGYAVDW